MGGKKMYELWPQRWKLAKKKKVTCGCFSVVEFLSTAQLQVFSTDCVYRKKKKSGETLNE